MEKSLKYQIRTLDFENKGYRIIHLTSGLEEMIELLLNRDRSYLLYGRPGTGKTTSLNLLKKYLKKNILRINSSTELNTLAARYGIDEVIKNINSYIEYDNYIIIDDLGSERINANHYGNNIPVMELLICDIIYRKWEESKNTSRPLKLFITTNYNIETLKEKYGERTISRLFQMCTPVDVDMKDKRIQNDFEL